MYSRSPLRGFGGGGGGLTGELPRDVMILLGVIFVTFSLQFFAATAPLIGLLQLTPLAWAGLQLWRLASYAFVGYGSPGFWFLLELLILFMFGRDVYYRLGRRGFWRLLVVVSIGAGVLALLVQIGMALAGSQAPHFLLMQGQRMLLTILIAAFATLNGRATILLFFVLPIEARWFLVLELVLGFFGYLSTGDLAGCVGIWAGVGLTWVWLNPARALGWRDRWLIELKTWWYRRKLDRMRKARDLRVVRDEQPDERREDDRIH